VGCGFARATDAATTVVPLPPLAAQQSVIMETSAQQALEGKSVLETVPALANHLNGDHSPTTPRMSRKVFKKTPSVVDT